MTQSKTQVLEALKTEIRRCDVCLSSNPPLPHHPRPVLTGKIPARIRVIGQAPGTRVHASGRPFTDPSGDRLREWMGIGDDIFYDENILAITPMGFCFPGLDAKGGDLPPRKECAPLYQERLTDAFDNIQLTLLIGMYAQNHILGKSRKRTLTETVRNWRDYGPEMMPLPHPSWRNNAWIKNNPWFEKDVLPELRRRIGSALNSE